MATAGKMSMLFRAAVGFMLSMPAALVAAEPDLAAAIRIRQNGPSVTPEMAKILSPQALGDLLLGPGHTPVTEVVVGPEGMEPPLPPGKPVATRVKLYLQPSESKRSGFCQRTVATIYLKPVDRLQDGRLPGSGPNSLSTEVAYRWVGEVSDASACEAPKHQFFIPQPGQVQHALDVVRLLALASQAAKKSRPLPFLFSVEDKLGPKMLAYQHEHPGLPPLPAMKIFTDPRKALASLPISQVTFAGPASTAYPNIILPSDLNDEKRGPLQAMTIFLGGDWVVGLVLSHGRIVRMRMLRQVPAPF